MTLIGQRFAYRERAKTLGTPVRPAEVVRMGPTAKSGKVKVRWLDGDYEGLEEWVPKVRLIVPWDEVQAFLEDERRYMQVLEATESVSGTTRFEAVRHVLWYTPLGDIDFGVHGVEDNVFYIDQFDDQVARMGLDRQALLAEPHSFIDRNGMYQSPFHVAEKVALLMCARYGQHIVQEVVKEETDMRQASIMGGVISSIDGEWRHIVDRVKFAQSLATQEVWWNLVKAWCGQDAISTYNEITELRSEVQRLQKALEELALWLQFNGHKAKAAAVTKQLRRLS